VQDLRAGTLKRVLPRWRVGTYRVYAAMPSRRHLPLRTRAFVDYLVEQYGGAAVDPWLSGKVS
jgi:DNA-binding transcriptional LysR family regulator